MKNAQVRWYFIMYYILLCVISTPIIKLSADYFKLVSVTKGRRTFFTYEGNAIGLLIPLSAITTFKPKFTVINSN
jgi:hypothetical protein